MGMPMSARSPMARSNGWQFVDARANGDLVVLITVSDTGYLREVAPDGRIVWRWANPDVTASGERAILFLARRYQHGFFEFLPRF